MNMKKYLVIGNPISHSLSPKLHNYWLKQNKINGVYDKEQLFGDDLKDFVLRIKENKINGANITVPFKKDIIPYLDKLTLEAERTQSVNTIYLEKNKIVGHNTDIDGFENAIKETNFDLRGKKIFILGAGGVVPSIIFALNKMEVSKIVISNRTKKKAENLKNLFGNISVVEWGKVPNFDMVINATSLGLKDKDKIDLDLSKNKDMKFFYDVIYNPEETIFLKDAKEKGNKVENGKKMFIYQAAASFKIWHKIYPTIDEKVVKLLNQ